MSIEYIRNHYSCSHKIGDMVQIRPGAGTRMDGMVGKLLRARGAYLTVKGETWKGDFHPDDVLAVVADAEVLSFDPFEGDFGSPGDKVFSNQMVVARKPGPCSHCGTEITKGERIRRQNSKFDGELMTHRWCALCCTAMASYDSDLGDDAREELPEYERRSGLNDAALAAQRGGV